METRTSLWYESTRIELSEFKNVLYAWANSESIVSIFCIVNGLLPSRVFIFSSLCIYSKSDLDKPCSVLNKLFVHFLTFPLKLVSSGYNKAFNCSLIYALCSNFAPLFFADASPLSLKYSITISGIFFPIDQISVPYPTYCFVLSTSNINPFLNCFTGP